MTMHDCQGCREYGEWSRRQFLGASGAFALAAAAPAWLPRVVYAGDHCSDRDVIVSIFLRGGCDGLTVCVPHAEDAYYAGRPDIAIPRPDSGDPNRAIDLDGFFGFPQAMSGLVEAYQAGHLALVHAVGSTDPSRSHFDAMRYMEIGKPGDGTLFTGWLGRHLLTSPPIQKDAVLRGLGMGYALQRTLAGGPLSVPVPDVNNYGLSGWDRSERQRREALSTMYDASQEPVRSAAANTQATIDLLDAIDFVNYQPSGGAVYPQTDIGYALKSSAALIKAQVGVEAIAIDLGGWDTHNAQGPIDGQMAALMTSLSNSLGAFHTDIFTDLSNMVAVVMSEFGRNVRQNGSIGTDHGHGNVMLALGDHINGGQVITQWPGLENLYDGQDLHITIDYRDILAEIVQNRLGNANLSEVFPGYTPTFRGITRC